MDLFILAAFLRPVPLFALSKSVRYGAPRSHIAEAPAFPWRGA